MKKFFILLLSVFLCCAAEAQNRSFQHLIGRWEAVDSENSSGGLEVLDSTKVFMVYNNEKKAIECKVDFTKSPIWFDFTIKDSTGTLRMKSLLQFVNDDLIQWQVFEGDAQPVQFASNSGDMVYLRRKK
jgi:hypothetical protein